MGKVIVTDTHLTNIADAIRTKTNTQATYMPSQMANAILGIAPSLQSKSFTPTASGATITPDSGYDGLSQVSVAGDSDLTASNIKHGVNLFNITGTFQTRIASVTATPSSRSLTIAFEGLSAEPLAFAVVQNGTYTFSKSYRWIVGLVCDGTTLTEETHAVSGSSMIGYTFTNCTWKYLNGTLTITSPSSGTNGYFAPMQHLLIYIYEQ